LPVPGARPSHGLIYDLAGYLGELAMLVLAECPQSFEGFMLGTAAATHQNSDSSVDDAAKFQGRL
jgi:hypothetical protein